MENIRIVEATKERLVVEIDLTKKGIRSASGKSTVVASSRGNLYIADADVTIGMNVYRKA